MIHGTGVVVPPYIVRWRPIRYPFGIVPTHPLRTLVSVANDSMHRRVLPVLHYPRNMVIYHYPLIGVIYMVILHVFKIKNYPNLFSNYYPKYKIQVISPFILN